MARSAVPSTASRIALTQPRSERDEIAQLPRYAVVGRQRYDLELIMNGGFAPLVGFMDRADYASVRDTMRLADGMLWPVPVVLDVAETDAALFTENPEVVLTDVTGVPLAVLTVGDVYRPDQIKEAQEVYGTLDTNHFGVRYVLERTNPVYVGGRVRMLALPRYYEYAEHRATPAELKQWFAQKGWTRVVGFQTRNPIHRAHFELLRRAAEEHDAKVLIHPAVGETKDGDIDPTTRVRVYREIIRHYAGDFATLNLLPLAMRMGGPREAVLHAIIRKNYGCTHFIIGRDHAGPGKDTQGVSYYEPYAAQGLAQQYAREIGIAIIAPKEMVYVEELDGYEETHRVKPEHTVRSISGTEFRTMLRERRPVPAWFSFPEVVRELEHAILPQGTTGFAVFFTGLSGSGKSTIAESLRVHLEELGAGPVTLLDGDVVRRHLSKELGFSKKDRDMNITRIGFVAGEIVKHGGVVLCAAIAPYARSRRAARELVEEFGDFIEVHVATPIEVCELRDVKGLYAKARRGLLEGLTGVNDPYEVPENAELVLDTTSLTTSEAVNRILDLLRARNLVDMPDVTL